MYIPTDFQEHGYDSIVSLVIRYNVSTSQLHAWKKHYNMLRRSVGRPPIVLTEQDILLVNRLREKHYSYNAIAKHLNICRTTLMRNLKKLASS